jgi:hypothetical protein
MGRVEAVLKGFAKLYGQSEFVGKAQKAMAKTCSTRGRRIPVHSADAETKQMMLAEGAT